MLDATIAEAQLPGRVNFPRTPQPVAYASPSRVVVAASPGLGAKRFVWTIVRDGENQGIMRQSKVSYRSMEEAYTEGAKVLKKLTPRA